jgi:nucleoid DNA-binding protein
VKKGELVKKVAKRVNLPQTTVKKVIDEVFVAIYEELMKGGRVCIKGFGTFKVVKLKERTYRNPKTGKKEKSPAKRVARFKPAPALRNL